MRKLIYLFILTALLCGCFHHRRQQISIPNSPHEAVFKDFKNTPKDEGKMFQTIGLDYFKQGNWAEAKNNFVKSVKADPKLYLSWYYLGLLNLDSPQGYDNLRKSADLKPDYALNYYWMAYYRCQQRDDRKAAALFRKYVELAHNSAGEEERVSAAQGALKELSSGKDGPVLGMIRPQGKN